MIWICSQILKAATHKPILTAVWPSFLSANIFDRHLSFFHSRSFDGCQSTLTVTKLAIKNDDQHNSHYVSVKNDGQQCCCQRQLSFFIQRALSVDTARPCVREPTLTTDMRVSAVNIGSCVLLLICAMLTLTGGHHRAVLTYTIGHLQTDF